MLETLVEKDDLLMDTPFLQRIRQQSWEEGQLSLFRENIIEALALRFNPPDTFSRKLGQHLGAINEKAELDRLFTLAIQVDTLDDFRKDFLLME